MDLLWPGFLLLLGVLPALVALRIWSERRRRSGLRYSSLSLVRDAQPGSSRVRRHLPFALFLLALASLVVATARPVAVVSVPAAETTVILAMDVSRSMCAIDIPPSRLLAAEAAAISFIERQAANARVGIVAFAGWAETLQSPTNDEEVLLDVIESLTTGRRTAVGAAILEALDAIAGIDESVAPIPAEGAAPDTPQAPVPEGAYAPAIIVLLTDGASNTGPLPVEAAHQAAARGVRVYTIGFGTDHPEAGRPQCSQPFIGSEPRDGGFGGFQTGGGGFRRALDEGTLREIAAVTGGTYYSAESADELHSVFQSLPTDLITRHEVTELAVVVVALAVLLMAAALLLGRAWRPLP